MSFLKTSTLEVLAIFAGSWFHNFGPETLKDLFANVFLLT